MTSKHSLNYNVATGSASDEEAILEEQLQEVASLSQAWRGFQLMKKHSVPTKGCTTLDDIKERLRLHFRQLHGQQGNKIIVAGDVIGQAHGDDIQKRSQLVDLLEEARKLLHEMDEQVLSHLGSEGISEDQLNKHIKGLQSDQCPILVTGETSSGKSSLLNVLLGREVLPHRLLSCTSCACKLAFSTRLHAKLHLHDDSIKEVILEDNDHLVDQLQKYIFNAEKREDEIVEYKEVEIFLPLDILKNGITIIDSPGFGESADMDKCLLDYITHNDIFAFIYVIKSDNAGGVQGDRLQKILHNIVDHRKDRSFNHFDPRAAVFVGNRWDLVPDEEKDLVKKDTFDKLSHCWPDLKDNQVFYLSTTKAWSNCEAGYVSEDYALFLEGISRLIPVGLQAKIAQPYKWVEQLLRRGLHHVTSYLVSTKLSNKELRARHATAQLRLHRVEKESHLVMERLTKRVHKSVHRITSKLSDFFNTEQVIKRLSIWGLDELAAVQEHDVWAEVEPEIDKVIEKRFMEILQGWDEEHRLFLKVQLELLVAFKEEFLLLETQISTVEQCLHQNNVLQLMAQTPEDVTKYMGLTQNIDPNEEGNFDFSLDFLQNLALGISTPVLLPVAVGLIIGAPIFLLWDLKKWRRRSISLKNLSGYIEDPVGFVTKRAHTFLSKVAEPDNVSEYVFAQLEPARNYLDSMKSAIPKLVESNKHLMESILKDTRTSHEIEAKYGIIKITIADLQEMLASFGNTNVRQYDHSACDIQVVMETTNPGLPTQKKITGIWTEVFTCELKKEKRTMTCKSYLENSSKVNSLHLMNEELQFRKVYHPCLAQLFGTYEARRGVPALLLEEGLVPARSEVFGFRLLAKASKGRNAIMERCFRVLEQVAVGLEYLHYRNIVHLELSLDTVMMVAKKDTVKLINLGEPRKVALPEDIDTIRAGRWVYLPPEALQGEVYTTQSDIYSLGLLAYELGKQELAFKPQRLQTLRQFTDNITNCALACDDCAFSTLIEKCVSSKHGERLCSSVWINEIRKLITSQLHGHIEEEEM